jgi:transposase
LNQIRSILGEHGVVMAIGPTAVRRYLERGSETTPLAIKPLLELLQEELLQLDARIECWEAKLSSVAKEVPEVSRLCTIPGIGLLTASALVSCHGDLKSFKDGRTFAAWLGVVPAQHSSGGIPKLLGISKRGNIYVRKLLVQGALSVIRHALKKQDQHSLWIQRLYNEKGTKRTAIALANKNARIAWRLMTSGGEFSPLRCHTQEH